MSYYTPLISYVSRWEKVAELFDITVRAHSMQSISYTPEWSHQGITARTLLHSLYPLMPQVGASMQASLEKALLLSFSLPIDSGGWLWEAPVSTWSCFPVSSLPLCLCRASCCNEELPNSCYWGREWNNHTIRAVPNLPDLRLPNRDQKVGNPTEYSAAGNAAYG